MSEQGELNINSMAPFQKQAAFNVYWSYSFISRAAFYAMINPTYYDYYSRFIRQQLYWYDGWVPWFHTEGNGIFSTRIATALVDRAAKKVVGGRVMFKNAGKDDGNGEALAFVSAWAEKSKFASAVKLATQYAAAAGTALIKVNKDKDGFWCQALRADSFIPTVGSRGDVLGVQCFIKDFTQVGCKLSDGSARVATYYLVENRYFGEYRRINGEIISNAPLVEYTIKRDNGNLTTGQYVSDGHSERVLFRDCPKDLRRDLVASYGAVRFDEPILLPYGDSLGCELVKWTVGVSNVPELPFGEGLLANLTAALMSWDYYYSAFNTDMYLGRGRVLAPLSTVNGGNNGWNAGIDAFLFSKSPNFTGDDQKPLPLQFDLRADSWGKIRDMLIQNIAVSTGMNISTIASFLQDNTARTAREISTEENETSSFVDDKREIIEKPLNNILRLILKLNGFKESVVIRWSRAGLTNIHSLAEVLSMGLQSGFISRRKAVEMFNFDDDTEQVQKEYDQCVAEEQEKSQRESQFFDGGAL